MKVIPFELNCSGMRYEYHRTREGPNFFVCFYKNSAVIRTDPKEAWRTLGVAKFTDCGKALKEWCVNIAEEYKNEDKMGRKDTSFANDTKMIT